MQEYFRAIRDQQVTTDYHLDRLAHSMTPAKKRKNLNHVLDEICVNFNQYDSVLSYMFKVAVFQTADFIFHYIEKNIILYIIYVICLIYTTILVFSMT